MDFHFDGLETKASVSTEIMFGPHAGEIVKITLHTFHEFLGEYSAWVAAGAQQAEGVPPMDMGDSEYVCTTDATPFTPQGALCYNFGSWMCHKYQTFELPTALDEEGDNAPTYPQDLFDDVYHFMTGIFYCMDLDINYPFNAAGASDMSYSDFLREMRNGSFHENKNRMKFIEGFFKWYNATFTDKPNYVV